MSAIRFNSGAIRDARQRQRLSLREVASRAGMAWSYLGRIERGESTGGSPESHSALAAALNVPVEAITFDADEMSTCPRCHGLGVVPRSGHTPSGAAA